MKTLITLITLVTLSTAAMAHNPQAPLKPKKKKAVMVKGKKAKAIYEALDTVEIAKDRTNFTVDVKKVASLRCLKLVNKADTSKVKYKCKLKGKKARVMRRGGRGQRGGNQL